MSRDDSVNHEVEPTADSAMQWILDKVGTYKLTTSSASGLSKDEVTKPLSIRAEVIQEGFFPTDGQFCLGCYMVRVEMDNTADTVLPLSLWTCSWFNQWKSDNDSIGVPGWMCLGNHPEQVDLAPGKSLVFHLNVQVNKGEKPTAFRLGFRNLLERFENLPNPVLGGDNIRGFDVRYPILLPEPAKGNTIWSNELSIAKFRKGVGYFPE